MVKSVTSNQALTERALHQSTRAVQPSATPQSSITQAFTLDKAEREMIREALNEGSTQKAVVDLVFQRRQRQASQNPGMTREQLLKEITELVEPEVTAYRQKVTQEFQGLPGHVRSSFGKQEALENYMAMRPVYYSAGYKKPAEQIFREIELVNLVGHQVVGGVHKELADRLRQVDQVLEGWSIGLAAQVKAEFTNVAGFVPVVKDKKLDRFVPRFVAGSTSLSNHAFGLAIDIDPSSNPHIKGKEVISALNWVVRELGFDFGKRFVESHPTIPDEDWVAQIHLIASQASQRVKEWLQQHLPTFKPLVAKIKDAERVMKNSKPKSKEYQQASAERKATLQQIQADENLKRVWVLYQSYGDQLDVWATKGIQTIPLYLAIALKKLGVKWGQTYKTSKDAMHFELSAEEVISKK